MKLRSRFTQVVRVCAAVLAFSIVGCASAPTTKPAMSHAMIRQKPTAVNPQVVTPMTPDVVHDYDPILPEADYVCADDGRGFNSLGALRAKPDQQPRCLREYMTADFGQSVRGIEPRIAAVVDLLARRD